MSRTPFPLIERPVGSITYEHTVVQRLFKDIFIGDAERNYYIDRYHETNLCAHYNVRYPGTFSFSPGYQFYVTDGRMSLKLHWSLGLPVEDMIIERYDGLEAAEGKKYYSVFCNLKDSIDREIERQKDLGKQWEYEFASVSTCRRQLQSGEITYTLIEMPTGNGEECVQVHHDEVTGEWKMSKSPCSIATLWNYLKDFDEINQKELHIMEYIPLSHNTVDQESPYYHFFIKAKGLYKNNINYF